MPGLFRILAVDLTGTREKESNRMTREVLLVQFRKQKLCRRDIAFNGRNGFLGDQGNTDGRRKVVDHVDAVDKLDHQILIADGSRNPLQLRMAANFRQIFHGAGRLIIDNNHVISLRQKSFAKMRTDKTGTTGDKNVFHDGNKLVLSRQ